MRVVVFNVETGQVDRLVSVRDGHDLDDLNMLDERISWRVILLIITNNIPRSFKNISEATGRTD